MALEGSLTEPGICSLFYTCFDVFSVPDCLIELGVGLSSAFLHPSPLATIKAGTSTYEDNKLWAIISDMAAPFTRKKEGPQKPPPPHRVSRSIPLETQERTSMPMNCCSLKNNNYLTDLVHQTISFGHDQTYSFRKVRWETRFDLGQCLLESIFKGLLGDGALPSGSVS